MYPRLRNLRQQHDLTQNQVANYLQMSQSGYSKYETGENDLSTDILIRLSVLYNTSIDYLLELTDETRVYRRTARQKQLLLAYRRQLVSGEPLPGAPPPSGKKDH